MEDNKNIDTEKMSNEEFNSMVEAEMKKQFEKVRMAGLLTGSKGICGVVMQYIDQFNMTPGKKSANDYKRLIKKINNFCSVSLSKKLMKPLERLLMLNKIKSKQYKIIEGGFI